MPSVCNVYRLQTKRNVTLNTYFLRLISYSHTRMHTQTHTSTRQLTLRAYQIILTEEFYSSYNRVVKRTSSILRCLLPSGQYRNTAASSLKRPCFLNGCFDSFVVSFISACKICHNNIYVGTNLIIYTLYYNVVPLYVSMYAPRKDPTVPLSFNPKRPRAIPTPIRPVWASTLP